VGQITIFLFGIKYVYLDGNKLEIAYHDRTKLTIAFVDAETAQGHFEDCDFVGGPSDYATFGAILAVTISVIE
jgi:hypothetical protein